VQMTIFVFLLPVCCSIDCF